MSNIDKIIISIPHAWEGRTPRGYTLQSLRRRCAIRGLVIYQVKLKNEWVMGVRRSGRNGAAFDGVHFKYAGGQNGVLTHVMLNPSCFESMDAMLNLLMELSTGWYSDLDCRTVRLDLSADYAVPFGELASGLRLSFKRKNEGHDSDVSGNLSTIYLGKKPDLLLAYDRNLNLRRAERHQPHWTRIERQIYKAVNVHKLFGYHVHFMNLERALLDLCRGRVEAFQRTLSLSEFSLTDRASLSEVQVTRQIELAVLVRHKSYARARKALYKESNKNFDRLYSGLHRLTPYPAWDHPNAVFRRGVSSFYSGSPIILETGPLLQRTPLATRSMPFMRQRPKPRRLQTSHATVAPDAEGLGTA